MASPAATTQSTEPQSRLAISSPKKPSSPAKPRVTFLTLPRELRQIILVQSFEPNLARPWLFSCLFKVECEHEAGLKHWVATFKGIDNSLVADVDYAEKIWRESRRLAMMSGTRVVYGLGKQHLLA
ncbi:hypothetical protein Vi05172_g1365 [Venturia inaequalis]|nr:hypothetical protein Vi05172_g1365 [Venturia inaequalis]